MTTLNLPMIGALSAEDIDIKWKHITSRYQPLVKRLQMRIAKAISLGKHGKVKALQWLLTHSFAAKMLAVKRVTSNSGKRTAGIDSVIWSTPISKLKAVLNLSRRGYKASPLRRTYIPKKKGRRPLGIPTMKDRAMQALHLLALEPIAESVLEPNSYGFRPHRSPADAIEQCFKCLAKRSSPQWILEGDIKSCFDNISHEWLLDNIKMDKQVLEQWLKCGVIDKKLYPTDMGSPQGAIISPTLANLTLSGMEALVKEIPKRHKVHIIIYADDFVVTAESKEILLELVKPKIEAFFKERGLQLSKEKTLITHIDKGFDFLSLNIRKYNGKLLIKPSKEAVKNFLKKVRKVVKDNKTAAAKELIYLLNPKIRGWTNYNRHVVAKKIFSYIDSNIFRILYKWIKRRHPNKSSSWRKEKYFHSKGSDNWVFCAKTQNQGKTTFLDLVKAGKVPIIRHVKIKGHANPYNPDYKEYFENRKINKYFSQEVRKG